MSNVFHIKEHDANRSLNILLFNIKEHDANRGLNILLFNIKHHDANRSLNILLKKDFEKNLTFRKLQHKLVIAATEIYK